MALSDSQKVHLKTLLQSGIPLDQHPYLVLAEEIGADEADVIEAVTQWLDEGLIKRMGLVVKHRALGYRANAMVVWDIADHDLDRVGNLLAAFPSVTLCYQRPRRLPQWPYNLFCMIHGRTREGVLAQLNNLVEQHQLQSVAKDVLFSYQEFKQCGARYFSHRLLAEPQVALNSQTNGSQAVHPTEKKWVASVNKYEEKETSALRFNIPVANVEKAAIGRPARQASLGRAG